MTDNEIIKALDEAELFLQNRVKDGQPIRLSEYDTEKLRNISQTCAKAYDKITRQQTENENLTVENQSIRTAANSLKMHYEEAQAEIERLQKEVNLVSIQFQDIQERQEESQAEIERLNKVYQANQQLINALNKSYFLAKSEAVKEFVEKLKKNMHNKFKDLDEYEFEYITERDIDNLVKEIVGENNG